MVRSGIVLSVVLAALVFSGAAYYTVFHTVHFRNNPQNPFLEIRDAASGRVYGKWPITETGEFTVEFIHSVHQSPVLESFRIEGTMIRPHEARFSSFGAGMQSDLGEGQTLSRDGNDLLITGFSSVFRELNYIVGNHFLLINGEKINLRELCGRNAHITIRYSGGKER